MAPKKNAAARAISPAPPPAAPSPATTKPTTTSSAATATTPKAPSAKTVGTGSSGAQSWNSAVNSLLAHYVDTTPQRTKLVDAFMAFLVAVGVLQFVYCVVAGNYVRFSFFFLLCSFGILVAVLVLIMGVAVQRVLVGLLGDGGAVCFDW
jgi:oligosaccharyltransferase complex subunit epsilon